MCSINLVRKILYLFHFYLMGKKKYCSCGELKFSLLSVQILKSGNSRCYVHKAVLFKEIRKVFNLKIKLKKINFNILICPALQLPVENF